MYHAMLKTLTLIQAKNSVQLESESRESFPRNKKTCGLLVKVFVGIITKLH